MGTSTVKPPLTMIRSKAALLCILASVASSIIRCDAVTVTLNPTEVDLSLTEQTDILLKLSAPLNESLDIYITYQIGDGEESYEQDVTIIQPVANVSLHPGNDSAVITVQAQNVGSVILGLNSSSGDIENLRDAFVRVSVVHSKALSIVIAVIGWIYFVAWSVSFYPQVVLNVARKSVVGLNFDFLSYNLTGFIAYGLFNIGMYWIPDVKAEYHSLYPRGVNPVQLNDVFFTIHAVIITGVTIVQCFIYDRGEQRLSRVCLALQVLIWLFALVTLFVTSAGALTWLTYLYYFSYIKLGITLIKYIPQALMNYRRKSTQGWSIGNVLLDFTGGSFSILQMFLIAYNHDDWTSIFGDPTKFGLGFFSILFDILFIVQHYCLYKGGLSAYSVITDVE